VTAKEDCVEYYLYPYSRLVKLACHWAWITLGIACAICAGITEIVTASVKSAYTLGYISGSSAFALVVRLAPTRLACDLKVMDMHRWLTVVGATLQAGILLVPVCVKGGIWNKLIDDEHAVDNPSYYEVIDVILRDISGRNRPQGPAASRKTRLCPAPVLRAQP
jgi:hypothetical protein